MFIEAIIVAIVIGYIFKGRLMNFENSDFKGLYVVFSSFFLEVIVNILIKKNIINQGRLTYGLDILMYSLLFYFIYLNRKEVFINLIGLGLFLNAIPIFLNGGSMPVSERVYKSVGLSKVISQQGLYHCTNSKTKLWFLCDIIPYKIISISVISIGDIIIAIGIMLFIIKSMRNESRKIEAV